jgi:uncharacterized coiled-coil protein SlyX
MRALKTLFVVALASTVMLAQNSTPTSASDASSIATQIKKLQDDMGEQQKAITNQQKKIAEQQAEIEKLKQQLGTLPQAVSANGDQASPHLANAVLKTSESSSASAVASAALPQEERPKESPLSVRIGGAEFTPGGFMDFTTIFRTTNEGTLGTNFFNIPYSNATTGHLTETRFTAQNSRISLKATDHFGKNDVAGYFEMDFLGNDGANIEVTSNSHTLRQRLYFVDLKRDKFELMAGQMWGWLTPNRVGLSSFTSDVFYSLDMDFNYQVGLTWTRQPGIRFIYHPNEHWGMGIGLENPEQFGGQGEITYPSAFNATLATQIDSAAGGTAVPNLHPDIIPKIAYDTDRDGKHFHAELAGLLSGFKIADIPSVAGATFVTHTKEGGGVSAAFNLEVVKNFHLLGNAFWSDGGGRYIFGMAPDLIVAPVNAPGATCAVSGTSSVGCDAALSLVHAGSGIVGFETQVTRKTLFYGYYGGMYAERNSRLDITSTAATQPYIGFGGPGSSNNNNRAIQEPSIGWIQTFWKSPQYGALQLITQGSYLTRNPWYYATGAPKDAHLAMVWVDLRYVLP